MHTGYNPELKKEYTPFGVIYRIADRIFYERDQEIWIPPEGDRFTTWEAKDESWLRPLGLGKVIKTGSKEYYEFITPKVNSYLKNFENQMTLKIMENPYDQFKIHMFDSPFIFNTPQTMIRSHA